MRRRVERPLTYDGILLATDGEVGSENATTHAIRPASLHDAMLHALFVVDEAVYSAYSGDEYVDEREGPEHGLEEVGENAPASVRARAADDDVDPIVLGTRRHPEEYRSLLGSVTDRVVRLCERPVTVIKTTVE